MFSKFVAWLSCTASSLPLFPHRTRLFDFQISLFSPLCVLSFPAPPPSFFLMFLGSCRFPPAHAKKLDFLVRPILNSLLQSPSLRSAVQAFKPMNLPLPPPPRLFASWISSLVMIKVCSLLTPIRVFFMELIILPISRVRPDSKFSRSLRPPLFPFFRSPTFSASRPTSPHFFNGQGPFLFLNISRK